MNSYVTVIIVAFIALVGGIILGTSIQSNRMPVENVEEHAHETPLEADLESMQPKVDELPGGELSQAEIDGLMLMREEEKMARDVYLNMYEAWGINTFNSVSQSESTHMDAVLTLINKYGLTDPVENDAIGVFASQEIQTLYGELIEQGLQSDVEALKAASYIEELDVRDLQRLIDETDNEDIKVVYENLLRGSRNHMRSFAKQLSMRGQSYNPTLITMSEYTDIITSEKEFGKPSNGKAYGGKVVRPCEIVI